MDKVVDCLCHNGEVSYGCMSGAGVGPHCVAWLLFMYGGMVVGEMLLADIAKELAECADALV